jgi:hypothetical protein
MKILTLLTGLFLITLSVFAQNKLSGKVLDTEGHPLWGANVYIKNSYDGASTDSVGHFSFKTTTTGKQILVMSYIGYTNVETEIDVTSKNEPLIVKFNQSSAELNPVVITAGTFEASVSKRSTVLKLMDIATTPSAVGDIYGALTTFPGTQIVGEKGGLFVRGGEGYEAKTFFDGMQAINPYFSGLPDIPNRGRFSPILFSGTVFSTGGYSAEYGQALSSALILNTTGIAKNSQSAISLLSVGVNGSHTQCWDNSSLAVTGTYSNMGPYSSLVKQNLKWDKSPESMDLNTLYRIKRGKYGLLKIYGDFNTNSSALFYNPEHNDNPGTLIRLRNSDLYLNTVYTDKLSAKWSIKTGLAFTKDNMTLAEDSFTMSQPVLSAHHRLTLTHEHTTNFTLKIGEEISAYSYHMNYFLVANSVEYRKGFIITNPAMFAESEFRIKSRIAIRAGVRYEYVSLLNEGSLVPRLSCAYKTGDNSQLSLAYGMFTQRPENSYLLFSNNLASERASHYIINYQFEKNNRIFRIEGYKKSYDQLVKYKIENDLNPLNYSNSGNGYSAGVDLFWRDSRTLRNLDYWVSYSFLNTKRNYKNYSKAQTPPFVSPHTFSMVAKYMFGKIKAHVAINYTHASSKTWFNPNLSNDIYAKTSAYNDISLNVVYLTSIFNNMTVVYFNVNNLFGFNNTFGYNYSAQPGENGNYTLYPIKPASKRFFLIGLFVSFK